MADILFTKRLFGASGGDSIQVKVMPTPSASKFKKIVEYIGETTANYTRGYFYECYISGTTPAVQEAFTVTQTAGSPIEEITTSVSVFKNKVHPTGNMNVQFTCAGKPTQVKLTKEGENLILDRYTPFDNPTQNNYCWKDSNNNYYYSHTELPVASTRFYLSSADPSVPSTTDSGWDYNSTTGRASTGQGVWVKDAVDYVTLSDYGIYLTGTGQISDVLQVAYVYPIPAGNTYAWRRINVQPAGGGAGGVDDVRIDDTSIVVNEVANIPTASTSQKGLVKVDGTTITINNGVISGAAQGANKDLSNLSATGEAHFLKSGNLKTINGNNLVGSGDITVKTYSPFPSDFVTAGTLQQVVSSMLDSASAIEGTAYLGGIDGACTPFGTGNVECKVEYMSSSIVVLTVNSSDVAPYSWFYNSASYDYKWKSNLLQVKEIPSDNLELSVGAIVQFIGTTTSDYTNGHFYKCTQVGGQYVWVRTDVQPNVEVINNVQSTATTSALSANMGKELQDQITHLKGLGKFLSLWNCTTGLPTSNPTTSPRVYNTGDYFVIGTVAAEGGTNYKPDGTQYVIGQASTVVETETVERGYVYWFDGQNWNLQAGGGGTVTDVQIKGTSILDASGVANIPISSPSTLGVIGTGASFNTNVLTSGYMQVMTNTYSQYQGKGNDAFIGKGTLENVLDNETVRVDKATSLTTTQQAQARSNIGAGTQSTIKYWS